jgi:hypothetical protein
MLGQHTYSRRIAAIRVRSHYLPIYARGCGCPCMRKMRGLGTISYRHRLNQSSEMPARNADRGREASL